MTTVADPIAIARAEVAALTKRHHALLDGTADWREWDERLTCWDRNEIAIEESGQALEDAQAELARLENGGTR